jgi:hypothetical protein
MYVEDETFVAVGADYGVRANAQSVDSTSLTVKIGPPENLYAGGHIQWFNRVAVTPQSEYYLLDIATLEAGRYVVQASQGVANDIAAKGVYQDIFDFRNDPIVVPNGYSLAVVCDSTAGWNGAIMLDFNIYQ